MNKLKEILISYARSVNPTEEQKQVAAMRLAECMRCEHWAENSFAIHYCKLCGCATKGKVFTPKGMQGCPKQKWPI